MTGLPAKLSAEHLYVFVFGPGFGESTLLRVPPSSWIVIDSLKAGGRAAAQHIMDKYGGRLELIVMTHPHADHHDGIVDLINSSPDCLVGCVRPATTRAVPDGLAADPYQQLKQGAKAAFTRISKAWEDHSPRRWETFRRSKLTVGKAFITSLHPAEPINAAEWGKDLNSISSALLVEWESTRIVLGADVPSSHWSEIGRDFPTLGSHHLLKVPHHGSHEAICGVLGTGSEARTWIVTPFNRGKHLPCADDLNAKGDGPEGMAKLLGFVHQLEMTSLPCQHDQEHEAPCITSRAEVRDKIRPKPTGRIDTKLLGTMAAMNRYVMLAFRETSELVEFRHGPGTLQVKR